VRHSCTTCSRLVLHSCDILVLHSFYTRSRLVLHSCDILVRHTRSILVYYLFYTRSILVLYSFYTRVLLGPLTGLSGTGFFQDFSRIFLGIFSEFSRNFPRNFQGIFQEFSRNFLGIFPEFSQYKKKAVASALRAGYVFTILIGDLFLFFLYFLYIFTTTTILLRYLYDTYSAIGCNAATSSSVYGAKCGVPVSVSDGEYLFTIYKN